MGRVSFLPCLYEYGFFFFYGKKTLYMEKQKLFLITQTFFINISKYHDMCENVVIINE